MCHRDAPPVSELQRVHFLWSRLALTHWSSSTGASNLLSNWIRWLEIVLSSSSKAAASVLLSSTSSRLLSRPRRCRVTQQPTWDERRLKRNHQQRDHDNKDLCETCFRAGRGQKATRAGLWWTRGLAPLLKSRFTVSLRSGILYCGLYCCSGAKMTHQTGRQMLPHCFAQK